MPDHVEPTKITQLLQRLGDGDQGVLTVVIPLVYDELKKLARSHLRREANAGPLQTTALVHEAYVKLAGNQHPSYENRAHFYGIASRLMRQILVDSARARAAQKRNAVEVALVDTHQSAVQPKVPILVLEDALEKLERIQPKKAQLIEMRYFGGMTADEISVALSSPVHVVRRDLRLARAWLQKEMGE